MGYTTEFEGRVNFDKEVDEKTKQLLIGLATTRRMKRNVGSEYGIEGEFFFGEGMAGQDFDNPNIIDYNTHPFTQPGLWNHWELTEDNKGLQWDGGEKFYAYVEWLEYLRDKVLNPAGINLLDGEITWQGEDANDRGKIIVKNNKIILKQGRIIYE